MLWNAGQERLGREQRDRLGELYIGVRDGQMAALIDSGQAKAKGDPRPSYIRGESPSRESAAAYRATLRRLGAMFPGSVREN